MMQKKTIFMMADGDTPFNGFCALYSLLAKKNCYRMILICDKVNNVEQILLRYNLNLDDIEILWYDGNVLEKYVPRKKEEAELEVGQEVIRPSKKKWTSKIKSFYELNGRDIHYSMGYLLCQTRKEIKRLKREEKIAKSVFSQYSPDILLLYTDRNIGLVQSMIYEAKINQIPRVIAPVTTRVALIQNLMYMRYGKRECEVDENVWTSKSLIWKINPDWIYQYKNKKYIFYQPWIAVAGWLLKRISLKPWIIGGGDATTVALSNEEDYEELLELCRDKEIQRKYILTKGIEETIISDGYSNRKNLREVICKKYSLQGEIVIIFALPQLFEHKMASWEVCRYNIIRIIESLLSQNVDILISLHPKMEKERYQFVEKDSRVRIVDEALSSIIGIADAFVVLGDCSTKTWAESLGIDIISIGVDAFCHKMNDEAIDECMRINKCEVTILDKEKDKKDFLDVLDDILFYKTEKCV